MRLLFSSGAELADWGYRPAGVCEVLYLR